MFKELVRKRDQAWLFRHHSKNNNITLAELLDMWMEEELIPGSLSNGTIATYKNAINRIKKHSISNYKLKNITQEHLQEFLDFTSFGGCNADGTTSKPLSKGYQQQFCAILQGAFRFAIFPKRLTDDNPMLYVKTRKKTEIIDIFAGQEEDVTAQKIIDHDQYLKLTDYLRLHNDPSLLAMQIAYYSGLRIGEICGLTWQDINLNEQFLTVRRSVKYNSARRTYEIDTTKRGKIRTIYFCDTLAAILKETRKQQELKRADYYKDYYLNYYKECREKERTYYELHSFPQTTVPTEEYRALSFVCVRRNGCYTNTGIIQNSVQRIKKLPGMENFHFHMLRHTYSSNLLSNGSLPINVQELLGHSDLKTTMSIYAHATKEEKRSSAKLLDKVGSS